MALLDQRDESLDVNDEFFAPLRNPVGFCEKSPGVQNMAADFSEHGVLGQDVCGERVGVAHEDGRRDGVPVEGVAMRGLVVLGRHLDGLAKIQKWPKYDRTNAGFGDKCESEQHR